MLLRQRARRQPPGHQLAARPAGVRPRGRQPHRRHLRQPSAATSRCRPTPPTARWPAWRGLDSNPGGEYAQDVANDIRATMQQHAGVFRTQARWTKACARRSIAAMRERVQAGIGLKDKSRCSTPRASRALEVENLIEAAQATMIGRRPPREPRRPPWDHDAPTTPEFPLAATTPNWMKHTLWYSPGNRLTTSRCSAADGRQSAAQGPHLLIEEPDHDAKRTFQIYRYDPTRDAKPACRPSRSSSTARAHAARRAG